MDKREYDEWLRGLIEQGRATPSPIDAAKPYVDAGDLDELDDEDLEDEDEDEDEESYKKGQKGAPPPGLSPTIEQLLSGNVVWYDPATLMHDASVGLGKDTDMKSADDRANEQFDLHCARAAGIAQEMASRLARDPRETKNWSLFAGGRMEPSVRLNGMFTFLRYSLDPGHQALLDRLVDETQKDLDRVEDVRARRAARTRHTLAGMPKKFRDARAQRSTLGNLVPNTRNASRQRVNHNYRSGPAPRVMGYDTDGVILVDLGEGAGVERGDGRGGPPLGRRNGR